MSTSCPGACASLYPSIDDFDAGWQVLQAQNIFLMQIGFMLLEVGSVRAMHAKAICVKNCADFLFCTIGWLVLGYPIAFGSDGGFIGQKNFISTGPQTPTPDAETQYWPFWFFQWSFCAATCTIVSGAGAERCSFQGYLLSTMLLASFVYPVVVHSMWAGDAWLVNGRFMGVKAHDFAGSGVVHLTGGVGAFMMAWTIGPRDGRFGHDGKVQSLSPHNLVLGACGGLFLITGIFVLLWIWGRSHFIKLEGLVNGMLAGLVAVTAGCYVLHPVPSAIVGGIGGAVYIASSEFMLWIQVDDPLDAAAIHGACGIWGLIAVGLFANGTDGLWGVFYGGDGKLLGSNIVVAIWICLWAGGVLGTAFNLMYYFDKNMIRVPIDIELQGDLVLYGGSAYPQFGKEEGDPPPDGEMVVVITDVLDSTVLWGWNPDVALEATQVMERRLRDNIVRFNGFEFADEGDSLSIVFHNAFDATRFGVVTQSDFMLESWPAELDSHPSTARDENYAGLRVRMAMDIGDGSRTLVNKRICFEGPVVESCKCIDKAVEDGGVVVASDGILRELQARFAHRLYELGEYEAQDLGQYKLPGREEPFSLVQMLPKELDRPASQITGGEMLLRPYSDAPGVEEMKESGKITTPIVLVFCTLAPLGADTDPHTRRESARATAGARDGQRRLTATELNRLTEDDLRGASADAKNAGDEDLALEILRKQTGRCDGYICKTSHGVSLVSFPTTSNALEFVQKVRSEIETQGLGLFLSVGIHAGCPSSVHPNKTTGRADYLGPVVNASARLLSLAGSRKQVFGSEISTVAVSKEAYEMMDSNARSRSGLECCGKFSLKGVEEEVEVYKLGGSPVNAFDAMAGQAKTKFDQEGDVTPGTIKS